MLIHNENKKQERKRDGGGDAKLYIDIKVITCPPYATGIKGHHQTRRHKYTAIHTIIGRLLSPALHEPTVHPENPGKLERGKGSCYTDTTAYSAAFIPPVKVTTGSHRRTSSDASLTGHWHQHCRACWALSSAYWIPGCLTSGQAGCSSWYAKKQCARCLGWP